MSATASKTPIRITLDRYTLESGPRSIVAVCDHASENGLAISQLLDSPEASEGRVYVIDTDLTVDDGLEALIADYKAQAADLGHCPMSRAALTEKLGRGGRREEAIS